MSTIAGRLAEHVTDSAEREVDQSLDEQMRSLLFDYLAVAAAGAALPSSRAAAASVATSAARSDVHPATIVGTDRFAAPGDAAFVGGVTGHGLELDDTHEEASLHPGVVVLPTVLAIGEVQRSTWAQLVRAAVAGYDVMCAAGVQIGADDTYRRGFHPTGVAGALGSAAAAALLRGLDTASTTMAIALAADMAAGSLEFLSDGSWTKRLNAGHAASVGIRAASLAASGFVGPETAIEGTSGWLTQYGHGGGGRDLDIEFGRAAHETSIKFYPCCRYMHGAIDLLREIHRDTPDAAGRARRIEVGVIRAGMALVADPPERKLVIETPVDAQFSMPFGAALALATGTATPEQFGNAAAEAVELADLMATVRCVSSAALEESYPKQWRAEVRVELDDGSVIERAEAAFRGAPANPATITEIREKAVGLIGRERADELRRRMAAMEPDDGAGIGRVIGAAGSPSGPAA